MSAGTEVNHLDGQPLVVWWWEVTRNRNVSSTYPICWVELVTFEERRAGTVQVSRRTANPRDLDDPAVRVELHYQLERRLGTTIRVEHARRHLNLLRVSRRLAAQGHRVNTLPLSEFDDDLLGGVATRTGGGDQVAGEVVVRAGLSANARDELMIWAERTLADAAAAAGSDHLEALGWAPTTSGGWQQLLYASQDPPLSG